MRPFDSSAKPFLTKTEFRTTSCTRFKLPSTTELRTSNITPLLTTHSGTLSAIRIKPNYAKLPSLGHKRYLNHSTGHRVDKIQGQMLHMMGSLANLNHELKELKHDVSTKRADLLHGFEQTKITLEGIVGQLNSNVCQTRTFFKNRNESMDSSLGLLSVQSTTMKDRLWQMSQRVAHLESTMGVYTGVDKYII